jgi:hypothetical protein
MQHIAAHRLREIRQDESMQSNMFFLHISFEQRHKLMTCANTDVEMMNHNVSNNMDLMMYTDTPRVELIEHTTRCTDTQTKTCETLTSASLMIKSKITTLLL